MRIRLFIFTIFWIISNHQIAAQNTYSVFYDIQNTGNSLGKTLTTVNDTLIIYTGINCGGCCQSTGIIQLNNTGQIINQKIIENMSTAGKGFIRNNDTILYLTTEDIVFSYGNPSKLCYGESNYINKSSIHNINESTQEEIFFKDENAYGISGIEHDSSSNKDLIYGQYLVKESLPNHDGHGYVYAKNNDELDSLFEFNEHIANNLVVDLQIDEEGNYHFLVFGVDDISAGSSQGDEKDPHWYIISIDNKGNILNQIHIEELESQPQSFSLLRLDDGNYIITSEKRPYIGFGDLANLWDGFRGRLVRVDGKTGAYLWDYVLPYDRLYDIRSHTVSSLKKAKNGDILLSGYANDTDDAENYHVSGFLARMDAEGNLLWHRIYKHIDDIIQVPNDIYYTGSALNDVIELENGQIAAVGNRATPTEFNTEFTMWAILTDQNGCLNNEECQEEITLDSIINVTEIDEYWPVGTTWYYDYNYNQGTNIVHDYIKYEIVNTSIENAQTIHNIISNQSEDTIKIIQEKLKAYVYDEENDSYPLNYDFDARNVINTELSDCDGILEEVRINVDSVAPFFLPKNVLNPINHNELIREQHLVYNDRMEKVLFGIGKSYGGLPFIECDGGKIGKLRCFNSDIYDLNFQDPFYDPPSCDTTWLEIIDNINEVNESKISFFPNPVIDDLNVDSDSKEILSINMYNNQGQRIKLTEKIESNTISMRGMIPGIYIIEVNLSNGTTSRKKIMKIAR